MTKRFINEIDKLKKKILQLTAMVEGNLQKAVKAVEEYDTQLAESVIEYDSQIDSFEVEVEEECLKILALHQPVATDLRYVIASLKINNDLERIGDLAVNIAKRTIKIQKHKRALIPFDLSGMLELTVKMVKRCTDSFIANDSQLARQVCFDDDEIDDLHKSSINVLKEKIKQDPNMIDYYISLLNVSRNLERIADHATNIAEDVIYNVEGEIVRHKGKEM
ncbi:MAG: phosphate signaling complex protein PhoU [candidate division Zixibacteria bacterium]|nr:phosphate signaling complex protein PhoU [candidate division Zixibacteria bacterium]